MDQKDLDELCTQHLETAGLFDALSEGFDKLSVLAEDIARAHAKLSGVYRRNGGSTDLVRQPAARAVPAHEKPPAPAPKQPSGAISYSDFAGELAGLMKDHRDVVKSVIEGFGVNSATDIDPDDRAGALESIRARIDG